MACGSGLRKVSVVISSLLIALLLFVSSVSCFIEMPPQFRCPCDPTDPILCRCAGMDDEEYERWMMTRNTVKLSDSDSDGPIITDQVRHERRRKPTLKRRSRSSVSLRRTTTNDGEIIDNV